MDETDFIIESNRIEGIYRMPTQAELDEFDRFMAQDEITVDDLIQFVSVYQPGAVLREEPGLNVAVGNHVAPPGGPLVMPQLKTILEHARGKVSPYKCHVLYETLHPFTDGNGRSGRMLWAWQMQDISLGFLHRFYYQALEHSR